MPEWWQSYLDLTVPVIQKFHEAILSKQDTPKFSLRYEDLRMDSYPTVRALFQFMIGKDLDGTVIEARIKDVCSGDHTTKTLYALKSTSTDMSRNRGIYSDD